MTVENLTAKILCQRHNQALTGLDSEAGLFFATLADAVVDLDRKTLSRKPIFHLIGGEALELWMLKAACGIYFSVGSKDGKPIAATHAIDIEKVHRALFQRVWDRTAGFYFRGAMGPAVTVENSVGISPLLDNQQRFIGASMSLLGFGLDLFFDTTNANPTWQSGGTRRPTELVLVRERRRHTIILTWPPGTPEASAQLQRGIPVVDHSGNRVWLPPRGAQ
jgi:hypothetical protein